MPPILFAALSYPFTQLGHALFPAPWANCIIAGAFTYCECAHDQPCRLLMSKQTSSTIARITLYTTRNFRLI